jgi:hypothetical protein
MIKLFYEESIDKAFSNALGRLDRAIDEVPLTSITPSNIHSKAEDLAKRNEISPLSIDVIEVAKDSSVVPVPWNKFPAEYDVHPGKTYDKVLVTYSYFISGNTALLSVSPKSRTFQSNSYVISEIKDSKLVLEYQTLFNYPLNDEQKAEVRENMHPLHSQLSDMVNAINTEVLVFNKDLTLYTVKALTKKMDDANDKKQHDSDL